ncbi:MAG: dihydrofolate reductase [Melioribacteraceae bacterium]
MKKIIIAAASKNGVIGNKGKIPWHYKEELKHFKKTTLGFPIIMGRTTFESLRKPLANRLNIVISKKKNLEYPFDGIFIFSSIKKAYNYLEENKYEKVFICGGERIYKSTIRNADEMIISTMNFEVVGEKKFPKLNMNIWKVNKIIKHKEFEVTYFRRIKKSK